MKKIFPLRIIYSTEEDKILLSVCTASQCTFTEGYELHRITPQAETYFNCNCRLMGERKIVSRNLETTDEVYHVALWQRVISKSTGQIGQGNAWGLQRIKAVHQATEMDKRVLE